MKIKKVDFKKIRRRQKACNIVVSIQNDHFRAWNTNINNDGLCEVLYIDYGNMSVLPFKEMMVPIPAVWNLPPMAKPFRLAGNIHKKLLYMGCVAKKPVFGVSDKERFKQVPSATETSEKIEIKLVANLDRILSKKRITKGLISLRGCAGWSAPMLIANP